MYFIARMTAIRLNNNQLKQLAEFTSNLGLVFGASVITPLFSKVDTNDPFLVLLGLALMVFSVTISLYLLKNKKI